MKTQSFNSQAKEKATHKVYTAFSQFNVWLDDQHKQELIDSNLAIEQFNIDKYPNSPDTVLYGSYESINNYMTNIDPDTDFFEPSHIELI